MRTTFTPMSTHAVELARSYRADQIRAAERSDLASQLRERAPRRARARSSE